MKAKIYAYLPYSNAQCNIKENIKFKTCALYSFLTNNNLYAHKSVQTYLVIRPNNEKVVIIMA